MVVYVAEQEIFVDPELWRDRTPIIQEAGGALHHLPNSKIGASARMLRVIFAFIDRSRQYIGLQAWRNLLHPLKRRQNRYCRSDSTVAVNQSCTEQSGCDDCGPVLLFHSK